MSRIERALEKASRIRSAEEFGMPQRIEVTCPRVIASQEQTEFYELPSGLNVATTNPFLVTVNEPASQGAEEYRKLKSVIAGMSRDGEFFNTIMVTSALGSEGKSITAINLAVSLAQECDHTVLLIDADLRKPSLHTYFGLEQSKGLADCLLDGTDVGEAFIKTGIGRLSFLPSGRRLENPAEMLSSQKMRNLMAEMKPRYRDRYLIIDTPPVLPVAETRSLSSMVDGVVFVVREGVPSREDVEKACGSLGSGKIVGVVYNDSASSAHSYRYSYSYGGYGGKPSEESSKGGKPKQSQGLLKRLLKRN